MAPVREYKSGIFYEADGLHHRSQSNMKVVCPEGNYENFHET